MSQIIKIAIAEDIHKIAEALKEKIELAVEFKVVDTLTNGADMIKRLENNHAVDVIMMDINMPIMDGVQATEIISNRWPHIKIIMCTVFDDEQNVFDAIMAGASGYLLKDESPAKVHKAIYEAMEGGAPMNPMIAKKALTLIKKGKPSDVKDVADYELTKREMDVLEQIAKGLSYDQIAENLFISYGTARKHVENIYKKMRVHNKIEAIDKAKKSGLI
ncbi:MAG: response regulator transcription factor [Crocinitomicaceae bacterium]|nr:response regulator transcription factor [Crocinitomicaceae bacterium]